MGVALGPWLDQDGGGTLDRPDFGVRPPDFDTQCWLKSHSETIPTSLLAPLEFRRDMFLNKTSHCKPHSGGPFSGKDVQLLAKLPRLTDLT